MKIKLVVRKTVENLNSGINRLKILKTTRHEDDYGIIQDIVTFIFEIKGLHSI
ncbi:hypothetical protein SAG0109_00465 [Streptococcus agalactiae BSU108]|nr:hypothetical protein SAG0109_00465 [Streptococcus agalactiae BSU108]